MLVHAQRDHKLFLTTLLALTAGRPAIGKKDQNPAQAMNSKHVKFAVKEILIVISRMMHNAMQHRAQAALEMSKTFQVAHSVGMKANGAHGIKLVQLLRIEPEQTPA